MANFSYFFSLALSICIIVTFFSSEFYKQTFKTQNSSAKEEEIQDAVKRRHYKLLQKYLFVYLSATFSDWLQGPYVYALYMEYGFEQFQIAELFVAGFGSSMVFGTFVGGMADWGGRRKFVILFAILFASSCITKHFRDFKILMIGRLLAGVSTSLLYSVFEAWLIRSHADADLPKSCLTKSFSWVSFSNSIVAIFAGLVANYFASYNDMISLGRKIHMGGYLNPFDFSLAALFVCGLAACTLWDENYGEQDPNESSGKDDGRQHGAKWYGGLQEAFVTSVRNRDILLCGIISSLFEASMYIFVFCWTPLLKSFSEEKELPFGLIFSTLMVSCMTGASMFSILVETYPVEKLAIGVLASSSIGMAIVGMGMNESISLTGMLLFEMCVGMYFPIMGTMKGTIVPESKRAAIYNLFRIPMNFIVLFSLLNDISATFSFIVNAIMLAAATVLQFFLTTRRINTTGSKRQVSKPEQESILGNEIEEGKEFI